MQGAGISGRSWIAGSVYKELYIPVDISEAVEAHRRRRQDDGHDQFAALEFAGVMQAQRELERNQRQWLFAWKDLRRAADHEAARAKATPPLAA